MSKTPIEWSEYTWNPVRGCSPVSPGCKHCYAERMAARNLPGMKSPTTGEPFAIMKSDGPHWTGKVDLIPSMLDIPLRRKKPTTYFVNSMSDLFHEGLPDEAIDRIFAVMALCPQHTFQVLTKRAERMREYSQRMADGLNGGLAAAFCNQRPMPNQDWRWPLPNVWLGVSVEDQQRADERIPLLLQTPAAVRFISAEPLLGQVDLTCRPLAERPEVTRNWLTGEFSNVPFKVTGGGEARIKIETKPRLDWVIVGGEAGPGARPCDIAWVRSIVEQCKEAEVATFVKQLGANVVDRNDAGFEGDTRRSWPMDTAWTELDRGYQGAPVRVLLDDRKGGDPSEWPEDLRVREMPEIR